MEIRSWIWRSGSATREKPSRPPVPNLMDSKETLWAQQHHANEKQRVDDQTILIEIAQRFREYSEDNCGQHNAGDRTAPAEHRHQHIIKGALKTGLARTDDQTAFVRVEPACHPGEERSNHERHYLDPRHIDSHRLCGKLVFADRNHRSTEARTF